MQKQEDEQRESVLVGTKFFIGNCIVCRSGIPSAFPSVSYCSIECRNNHEKRLAYAKCRVAVKKNVSEFSKLYPPSSTSQYPKGKRGKRLKKKRIRFLLTENQKLRERLQAKPEVRSKQQRQPHPFYDSRAWRELRYQVIKTHGRKCQACGDTSKKIHVDHIKPRSKYPELELDFQNLQILCEDCNLGKSNSNKACVMTTGKPNHSRSGCVAE